MVLKRLHRPMIFATTVEDVQTAARRGLKNCGEGATRTKNWTFV